MSPDIVLLLVRIALALALYGFLGLLLTYLWRDTNSIRGRPESPESARLDLLEGGEVRRSFTLAEVNSLGRAVSNTICLTDSTVSAHHAEISYSEQCWWLEDVGSSNGTVVNGATIEARVALSEGDQIEVGNTRLRLHLAPSSGPAGESTPSTDGREEA